MAYILNVTETDAATAATYTVELGLHATGDLLLVCLTQDGAATAITQSGGSDWTFLGTQAASGGCRQAWAYKIATSGSETNPTFAGSNDDWLGVCLVIRDAHATEPFGATPTSGTDFVRTDWNAVSVSASGSLTTAVDDCLLIYSWGGDGPRAIRVEYDSATGIYFAASSAHSAIAAYLPLYSAGAAPIVTMNHFLATEGGNGWVLAVRNKANGIMQPYAQMDSTEMYWYGGWPDKGSSDLTFNAPNTLTASINSITCSSTAPAYSNATSSDFSSVAILDSTESTTGAFVGGVHAISSTDFTGDIIRIIWALSVGSTNVNIGAAGVVVGFSDGTNWVVYQLASKSLGFSAGIKYDSYIDPATAIPYASSGSINWAAVTSIAYFYHRQGSTVTSYSIRPCELHRIHAPTILTGGASAYPVTVETLHNLTYCWPPYIGFSSIQGKAQYRVNLPIQIGDGVTPTYYEGDLSAIEFPIAYSLTEVVPWQQFWNVGASAAGIDVYAGPNDTIRCVYGLYATNTNQPFSINASTDLTADYSFAQTYSGFSVVWNDGLVCEDVVFYACRESAFAATQATRCRWNNSLATTAAITLQDGASITDSTFVAGSESYAVEITEAGDYTLEGNTYTGYTKPIYVSATTGTVTVSILSSDSVPTYDTDGATVVINQPYTSLASVTNLVAGSRVRIYNVTTATETYNGIVASTSYSQGYDDGTDYTAGDEIEVRIAYHSGVTAKLPVQHSTLATAAGWTVLVDQQDDVTYNANGIDGDAVTEFVADYPNVQIDINDPDGTTTPQRGYAWYIAGQLTEDGISYYHGAMTAEDEFNYRINTAIADMHIQNISVDPVYVVGARLYRDDGTNVTVAGTGPIQMEYGRTYAASGDAAQNAAAVWESVLEGALTAEQMQRVMLAALAGKRSGLGTAVEEYMAQDGATPRVTFTPTDARGNGSTVVNGA